MEIFHFTSGLYRKYRRVVGPMLLTTVKTWCFCLSFKEKSRPVVKSTSHHRCTTCWLVIFHNITFSLNTYFIFQIENGVQNGHGNHWNITLFPDSSAEELQQCKVIHRTQTNLSENANETVNVREQECTKWEYDTSQFTSTIVSKVYTVRQIYISVHNLLQVIVLKARGKLLSRVFFSSFVWFPLWTQWR